MSNKTLLLISDEDADETFATAVAKESGLTLEVISDVAEAVERIKQDTITAIFLDSSQTIYRSFEDRIKASIGLFSDKINANAIHYLSSKPLEDSQYLIDSPFFGHFVLRNYGDPTEAGRHYGRIVRATMAERSFGLQSLLDSNAKIQVVHLKSSQQKQDAVEAVKNYLVAAKFQTRMATVIANAVDELVMNAIFDAPADEMGKQTLVSTSRATVFQLEGKSAVEMHVGYDGSYVAVTAVDHWGSLDKLKLLTHISKIYTEEEYKVRTSVAGAGIGLATVFRSGGSFFFVSESRTRTEVTVFFKRMTSYREFRDQFKFISTQFYF